MNNKDFLSSSKKHICLISNHGYAGVNLPISEAPDTGGQNIFVHYLSYTLTQRGYKITIFTRGGFPFYHSTKIRKGIEFLSPFIRYVYVPGGPGHFIAKEDIASILNEEIEWLYDFIHKEASHQQKTSYQYFSFINSHYWDAGLMAHQLIKRWQTDLFLHHYKKIIPLPQQYLVNRHKLHISQNINYFAGEMFITYFNHKYRFRDHPLTKQDIGLFAQELNTIAGKSRTCKNLIHLFQMTQQNPIKHISVIEKIGGYILQNTLPHIQAQLIQVNKHVWLPHTLGALKEKNYWDHPQEMKRSLKFLERIHYEQTLINETPVLMTTSQEIIKILKNYYNADLTRTIYFPPCNDETIFKPRKKEECQNAINWLKRITKIRTIEQKQIILESSRMDYSKRKDILIHAFNLLKNKYKNLVLLIGGGPQNNVYADLKKLVSYYNLEKRIFFIGYLDSTLIGEIFSIPLLYASPSEMEGFGISILNAAASKVAIISSPHIPLTQQYLKKCVFLVKKNNAHEFSKAIAFYLNNPELRVKHANHAYHIAKQFNWTTSTEHLITELKRRKFV